MTYVELKPEIDRYVRQFKRRLALTKQQKALQCQSLLGDMMDFLDENPDADFASIQKSFGSPKECARACSASLPEDEQKKGRRRQLWGRICVIVAAAVIAFGIFLLAYTAMKGYSSRNASSSDTLGEYSDTIEMEDET